MSAPNGANSWYLNDITIRITAGTSANSGATGIRYSIDGGTNYTNEQVLTKEILITQEGINTIIAYEIDENGTQSTEGETKEIKLDKADPTAELTLGTPDTTSITATARETSGNTTGSPIASYRFDYKLSTETNWTEGTPKASSTHTYEGLKSGTMYEFRVAITEQSRRTCVSKTKVTTMKNASIIPTKSDIGKYVYYTPVEGKYSKSLLDAFSGSTQNSDIGTDHTLKWQILNTENNILTLISETVPNSKTDNIYGELRLEGWDGYNNGVKLLDDICNTCYGNPSYTGLRARNLKCSDVKRAFPETVFSLEIGGQENPQQPSTWNRYPPKIVMDYQDSIDMAYR